MWDRLPACRQVHGIRVSGVDLHKPHQAIRDEKDFQ